MGSARRALVWLVAALAVVPILAKGQQQPTFRAGTKVVSLYATVTEAGRLVPGLAREDFEILDNGVAQTVDLVTFEEIPLNIVLAFDVSGSLTNGRLAQLLGATPAMSGVAMTVMATLSNERARTSA